MISEPKPIDFGPVGLAAALGSTPEQILAWVHAGVIRPDFVRDKAPRWHPLTLADIFKQLTPKPQDRLAALKRAVAALEALVRAEKAEGFHDDKGGAA
jgi:hypothetical protein